MRYTPTTRPPVEAPRCGRCPKCHPGRAWGGDEKCTIAKCTCHRGARS